jgi:putative CocE/NonD family hydrolase
VILVRTPYLRATSNQAYPLDTLAGMGYVVVAQDVRGKGDSGGTFSPWVDEGRDGADTIAWLARAPWSNGRVGMLGGSYLGAAIWAAADRDPPALRAMVVLPAISDPFYGGAFDSGIFSLAPGWPYENSGRRPREVPPIDEARLRTLPLAGLDEAVFGETVPIWDSYLARETRGAWASPRWPRAVCASNARALMFAGLWDGDGIGPARNWEARQACRPGRTALVLGPWGHSMAQNGARGDVAYGENSRIQLMPLIADWFDRELRGIDRGPVPAARIFVTGENRWRAFAAWPPRAGAFDFHPGGAADADGRPALTERAGRAAPLPIVYAPQGIGRELRPALFVRTTLMPPSQTPGDQLVFATAPFAAPARIGGAPVLRARVVPGDDDADLFAFIVDIAPDGTMRAVTHPGKLRLSYRKGMDRRLPLRPGRPVDVEVRLWDFAHRFDSGHRLGLILRSEWFPRWALNTGAGPIGTAAEARPATHRIVTGPDTSLHLWRLD